MGVGVLSTLRTEWGGAIRVTLLFVVIKMRKPYATGWGIAWAFSENAETPPGTRRNCSKNPDSLTTTRINPKKSPGKRKTSKYAVDAAIGHHGAGSFFYPRERKKRPNRYIDYKSGALGELLFRHLFFIRMYRSNCGHRI